MSSTASLFSLQSCEHIFTSSGGRPLRLSDKACRGLHAAARCLTLDVRYPLYARTIQLVAQKFIFCCLAMALTGIRTSIAPRYAVKRAHGLIRYSNSFSRPFAPLIPHGNEPGINCILSCLRHFKHSSTIGIFHNMPSPAS
jgi:hypothetical protein